MSDLLYILKVLNYTKADDGKIVKHYITYAFENAYDAEAKIAQLDDAEYEVIEFDEDSIMPLKKVLGL